MNLVELEKQTRAILLDILERSAILLSDQARFLCLVYPRAR